MEPSKILSLPCVFFLMDFKSFSTNKRFGIYKKKKKKKKSEPGLFEGLEAFF